MARRFTVITDRDRWSTITHRAKQNQTSKTIRRPQKQFRLIERLFTKPIPASSTDMFPSSPSLTIPSNSQTPNPTASSHTSTKTLSTVSANTLTMSSQTHPTDPYTAWYSNDPTTKKAYLTDPCLTGKLYLDPEDHSKPGWKNRCFTCLVRGHPSTACKAPIRACARCFKPGHGANTCPKLQQQPVAANLLPRGNLGSEKMPRNRLTYINVFLPQSSGNIHDLRLLL